MYRRLLEPARARPFNRHVFDLDSLAKGSEMGYHGNRLLLKGALPHQKSSPAACLTGDQEFLEGFAADKTDWGDCPWKRRGC